MARDPQGDRAQIERHQRWLGYLQPQGLVVAPAALVDCQAYLRDDMLEPQRKLRALLAREILDDGRERVAMPALRALCVDFLGWDAADLLAADDPAAAELDAPLPEYHETLRPSFAVCDPAVAATGADAKAAASPWLLLIQEVPRGVDFDQNAELPDARQWQASWHARFERLLRETNVPTGLLFNGTQLRLVHAPKGESSGHLTFTFRAMEEVAGRPILAGLLLLEAERLFTGPVDHRLPALLSTSRKYQNRVSTQLAEQVLEALHELLKGFQAASAPPREQLVAAWLRERPEDLYGGLLTTILRLIFLLYAEDRGLLGTAGAGRGRDEVFASGYSLQGLFERLREDADRWPDTMDARFGAWAQLLALFRLVHDGGRHGALSIPARHGYLFDPDGGGDGCYQFLEGRPLGEQRQLGAKLEPPRVSDGVVWRVLSKLMLLDGERISYRTLDVEQIGSVYETMMGFRLETTRGPSLAIKPAKPHGAPAVVNLADLLEQPAAKRAAWLKEQADFKPTDKVAALLKEATTPEAVHAALGKKVASITPNVVPAGTMVLQPSDARRRSGSHYTPPGLTRPIVETTLRPILEQLGPDPTPEQLLALKVCDPAMGSGAFLVEACRQLSRHVVKAWHRHGCVPVIPPDEDEEIHARRLVARNCLYGVDKNPFAVALAKLSLWLVTFAKDHPFTFVDHQLRCGDSLVGLAAAQIRAFGLDVKTTDAIAEQKIRALIERQLARVSKLRAEIHAAGEGVNEIALRQLHDEADHALADVRLIGDLAVRAFFSGDSDRKRRDQRERLMALVQTWMSSRGGGIKLREELQREVAQLKAGEKGVTPFHWEVEFPEVFSRYGFDAFVGNPPFAGKNTMIEGCIHGFLDWLKGIHEGAHGNADLVAHFFRRAFSLLRSGGTFGLIATNTIAQGDTRSTGLSWICTHDGVIYSARRRTKWPGEASVVVSVIHVAKAMAMGDRLLDDRSVSRITAFLFHDGSSSDPKPLAANAGKAFQGTIVLGMGFTFDDTSAEATPLAVMHELVAQDSRNSERIQPYLGGDEIANSPTHAHHRFVINFGEMSEADARCSWPDLMRIVESKVRPARAHLTKNSIGRRRAQYWWQHASTAKEMWSAIRGFQFVLAHPFLSKYPAFALVPAITVVAGPCNVFALSSYAALAMLQSRVHESWTRFFGSSLEDDLRYTPTDCFETFPFPPNFESDARLEAVGKAYYEFRAALMIRHDEGLTKTYNHFHNPPWEPTALNAGQLRDIEKLRELHAEMDRAVLDAYGWTELKPTHQFLLDYEEEDDDDGEEGGRTRRRMKPYRWRWPDDFRDEVLMRLLRLNEERAKEEALHAPPAKPPLATKRGNGKAGTNSGDGSAAGGPATGPSTPSLFGPS